MDHKTVVEAKNPTATLLALGAALGRVQANPEPGGRAFVIVPDKDGGAQVVYLERADKPARSIASVVTHDVDSFCTYVLRHRDSLASVIYAKLAPASFLCVLNDHGTSKPNWRDHRVGFTPAHSLEYTAWSEHDRQPMGQREFIEFIEEQLHDFVSPTGARMYEIATNFKAKAGVNFKSAINQANGSVDFQFIETVEGGAGATGKISIPEEFRIHMPVWSGLEQKKYEFDARLRYKLANGQLTFHYVLDRPAKVVEEAFTETLDEIKKKVDKSVVIFGDPGPR